MQLACCNGRPVHGACRSPSPAGSVKAAIADAAADRADPVGQVKLIQVLAISHVQAVAAEDSLKSAQQPFQCAGQSAALQVKAAATSGCVATLSTSHHQELAAAAGGVLADGLLPTLVARLALHFVVHPLTCRIVAINEQIPAITGASQ